MTELDLPYKQRTPQVEGRRVEKGLARERGARLHPNSGAGSIKDDASNDDTVYEFKNANLSFTLNSRDLYQMAVRALRQGKDAVYVVRFANGITAEVNIRKEGHGTSEV